MQNPKTPLALIILDGWGYREEQDDNAIANANTPVLDGLIQNYANTLISGSGIDVGLPDGQMGNSEVGHVNLGAGRVVYQDFTRITKSIDDGDFYSNTALIEGMNQAISTDKAIHIMGLMSAGGVHSHQSHIFAAIKMAVKQGASKIYLHCFLDGRDTPPRSAQGPLEAAQALFDELGVGQVASLIGRYYAMDRDKRWDRVEKAYKLLTQGVGDEQAASAMEGLEKAYAKDLNDEFVTATWLEGAQPIQDGDCVIFMNFRADRARQLSQVFVDSSFTGFDVSDKPDFCSFVSLTQYEEGLATTTAFPPEPLTNVMGEWLALHDKTQLRISETEKYAHVTFFYSGGREKAFAGEKRELIPSPDVATYDLQPEMNAPLLTDKLVAAIKSGEYDVIICNYPNGDMVGHTGNYAAAVKACEVVDSCIGRVVEALQEVGGECLITADHGNAEQMLDHQTGQAHTAHTSELVPFIFVGREATTRLGGTLSDVAPTMLHLMGMAQPEEMTGKPIVTVA